MHHPACRPPRLPAYPPPLQSAKQRLLVQSAAVQLRDAHGNAAGCAGVQVRFRLRVAPGAAGASGGDGEPPQLEPTAGRGEVVETDEQGRAFFGHLLLAQGSGGCQGGMWAGAEAEEVQRSAAQHSAGHAGRCSSVPCQRMPAHHCAQQRSP